MLDNNEKKAISRRKLLKGLAAGGGAVIVGKSLPENWSRPVVDSVMLPAHALTSEASFTGNTAQASIAPGSMMAGLLGGLVNEAQAIEISFEALEVCIKADGAGTVSVDALVTGGFDAVDVSASNVPVGGVLPTAMSENYCGTILVNFIHNLGLIKDAQAGVLDNTDVEVVVDSVSGNAIGEFVLFGGDVTIPFNLPPGPCTAPDCPSVTM